ncbi:hypothetical protein [Leeuwenhoekiella sp. MAR_2009_132]|uniref:hypothetical protein n=1 Tax=Leeuwenhoekiella sp. MAR_2009_132 TaxID=1392489 RepID=UPI00048E67D1|nr:hypothetical protein [Leeuwenhoekiella sp. MAR_2009_132]
MKINKLAVLALFGAFVFNSCTDDNDDLIELIPEGDYTDGFFVTNEGSFGSGGSVSYVSNDLETSDIDVYTTVNSTTSDLGLFVQSIFFDDANAYIISNGSNIITVVDRYTFEYVGAIDSDLAIPRYGVALNGKAYVTNQDDFSTGADDFVAIIDLETLTVESTVLIGNKVEYIQEENNLLYIQGASFNDGNNINVFDPTSNIVVTTYTTADKLNSFDIEDDVIYALTATGIQQIDINTGVVTTQIRFSDTFESASYLDVEDDMIYFVVGTSVYQIAQNSTEEPSERLLTYNGVSVYGFEVEDNRIYIADSGDYISNSFIEVYTLDGNLLKNVTVGIAPNGFYFN